MGRHVGEASWRCQPGALARRVRLAGDALRDVHVIRFNMPSTVGTELAYLAEAVEAGRLSSSGNWTRKRAQALLGRIYYSIVLVSGIGKDSGAALNPLFLVAPP